MKRIIPVMIVAILLATSCVSKKKYENAEYGRLNALTANSNLRRNLADTSAVLSECLTNAESLRNQIQALQKEKEATLAEKENLSTTLLSKNSELSQKEQTIAKLENIINEQNKKVKDLLSNVQNALLGFNSDELTVTQKNGKVYVALSDKLLFESGSATVDKRGAEALGKLADVLNKQSDIDVYIEGHTDNRPIKTAQFKDNWDLSVIRATSVVRILTKDYGVNPLQIIPTGRGEYLPVADNTAAEGRSKNRRTEIIMSPKLDKLFDILQ